MSCPVWVQEPELRSSARATNALHHRAWAPAPPPPSPQGLHSSTTSSITTEPAIQAPALPPPSLFKIAPKCLILQKPAASLFQHSVYMHCFGERLWESVLSLDIYWKKKEHFNCGNSLTSLQNASVRCSMVSDPPMPRSLNHCCNCRAGTCPSRTIPHIRGGSEY